MKQDVNFLLLGLLVLILCSMVGMAIYAQNEYKKLNESYAQTRKDLEYKNSELDNKSLEINKTRTDLETRQRALVDIVNELNLSQERESSLGGFFENLKGEKEVLETNLNTTIKEKDKLSTDYASARMDLNVCRESYKLKENQLVTANGKISSLGTSIRDIGASLNKTKSQVSSMEDSLDDVNKAIDKLNKKISIYTDADMSQSKKTEVEEDLDSLKSMLSNKINQKIDDLKSTLSAIERKTSSGI